MKAFKILAAVFLAAIMFSSAAEAQIKVGVYLPLTGQNAFGGQLELDGINLAAGLQPTVLGQEVQLVVMDNKSDKIEAANTVRRLIESDNVVAIIGTYGSSLALAGGEVAEVSKVPVVGTSCTNPLVTSGKTYYFRACFIDPYQGAGAATYAFESLGAKKAALLTDVSNDYAVGLGAFFRRAFTDLGGEIVAELNYNSGDQDFTAQLTEIVSKNPDVMFMPAYFAEGGIIMKQARELGAAFRIMGGDAMDNPDTVKIAGEAAEGFIHTSFPYDPGMPNMNAEARAFTDAWNAANPDNSPNVNAALGYTSYIMILDAITRAGEATSAGITEALNATKDLATPLGLLTLDADHNPQMPVGIIEIKGGERVYLGEVQPK
ncbi:MAG: ABC transporter substrate-binding protein [Deltaproteobacteria bacterium]|jgi:branched-chain amino acid transport system substrate-binding protein|nr:ABC transporter substrate-binding protein [Deltaproteobacteria bacterium]